MKLHAALRLFPIALLSLGACVSMRPTMTRFSLDYNRVVADTRNRMILLNIVRAAYREPTYYTALSQIEGSLNMQGSFSGEVANLAGGDATSFTPTVGGSITNAPTFTVVPLTSEEFSKGMLKPIDPETIQLLLSQGWKANLLAPFVVEKVQCLYNGQVFDEIENDPDHYGAAYDFATMSRIALQDTPPDAQMAFGFYLKQEAAAALIAEGALDKFDVQKAGLSTADKTSIALTPKAGSALTAQIPSTLKDLCRDSLRKIQGSPKDGMDSKIETRGLTQQAVEQSQFDVKRVDRRAPPKTGAPDDKTATQLVFRSPDEIVYFLGNLLRHEQRQGQSVAALDRKVLFRVSRNASGPTAIEVEHHGAKWSVAMSDPMRKEGTSEDDRTLEVIALLNQLIASQTSAADFSRVPSVVRVR